MVDASIRDRKKNNYYLNDQGHKFQPFFYATKNIDFNKRALKKKKKCEKRYVYLYDDIQKPNKHNKTKLPTREEIDTNMFILKTT